MSSQAKLDNQWGIYQQQIENDQIEEARKQAEAMIAYLASQANEPQTPQEESGADEHKQHPALFCLEQISTVGGERLEGESLFFILISVQRKTRMRSGTFLCFLFLH